MMEIFLRHKTAHSQYKLALDNSKFIKIILETANIRLWHTIIYKMHIGCAVVFSCDQILYYIGDNNHFVGKPTTKPFSEFEHRFCHKPPFVAVIIGSMMRKNHLQTAHFGVWHKQCRTNGVDVQNIRLDLRGIVYGAKSMYDRLEGFLLWTSDVNNLHPMPILETVRNIIAASNYRYINAHCRNPRKQLLTMRLHPAHDIGYATCASNNDFQNFWILNIMIIFALL